MFEWFKEQLRKPLRKLLHKTNYDRELTQLQRVKNNAKQRQNILEGLLIVRNVALQKKDAKQFKEILDKINNLCDDELADINRIAKEVLLLRRDIKISHPVVLTILDRLLQVLSEYSVQITNFQKVVKVRSEANLDANINLLNTYLASQQKLSQQLAVLQKSLDEQMRKYHGYVGFTTYARVTLYSTLSALIVAIAIIQTESYQNYKTQALGIQNIEDIRSINYESHELHMAQTELQIFFDMISKDETIIEQVSLSTIQYYVNKTYVATDTKFTDEIQNWPPGYKHFFELLVKQREILTGAQKEIISEISIEQKNYTPDALKMAQDELFNLAQILGKVPNYLERFSADEIQRFINLEYVAHGKKPNEEIDNWIDVLRTVFDALIQRRVELQNKSDLSSKTQSKVTSLNGKILIDLQKKYGFDSQSATVVSIIQECVLQGISQREQIAYVLATVQHESSFKPKYENMNYSAKRIREVFPKYIKTLEEAKKYAGKPKELANKVYGGRLGNGGTHTDDGWLRRGRGFTQITGKTNDITFTKLTGVDLANHPEKALEPSVSAKITIAGFKYGKFTGLKLSDFISGSNVDYVGARRCINIQDRASDIAQIAKKWEKILKEQYIVLRPDTSQNTPYW
jgi:putative chitinase